MASEWLLRIPRVDETEEYVLVNIASTGEGSDLDLDLTATDNASVFALSIRQRSAKNLMGHRSNLSDDQWLRTLEFAFQPKKRRNLTVDFLKGFEMVAEVKDEALRLVFRQRVGELTKGLGSISLPQTEQEIDIFEWASASTTRYADLEEELFQMRTKYESATESIQTLSKQLEELTVAKAKHEEELLAKCVLLLNEKKFKIRNQQRVLVSAKIDERKVKELESKIPRRHHPSSNSARAGKRKAAHMLVDSDSDEDAFEKMDIDKNAPSIEGDSDEDDQRTPDRSDEETEGEEEDAGPVAPMKSPVSTSTNIEPKKEPSPPPPRELPFLKAKTSSKSRPPPEEEDTEGEMEDDEL